MDGLTMNPALNSNRSRTTKPMSRRKNSWTRWRSGTRTRRQFAASCATTLFRCSLKSSYACATRPRSPRLKLRAKNELPDWLARRAASRPVTLMSTVSGITTHPTCVTDGSIRSFSYARFSSDGQNKASITDQLRNCRELAERKGWAFLEHLNQVDEELTGRTKFGRKGLETVLAIAKTKPRIVDRLICDDTSRLGRNAAETLQTGKILLFHGIALYFVEDGLDSDDPSFWDNFCRKAVGDEGYSRSLGAKVKRGKGAVFSQRV